MKYILLLLLISFTGQIFSQETVNQTDANGLRQGLWKKNYPNGKLIYQGQFSDGKPVGIWKRYHDNGKKQADIIYSEVSDSADTKLYDEAGKLIAEGIFLNEQKVGVWKYFSNNRIVAEDEFLHGLKNGLSRKFYQTGEVFEEAEWKNNLKEGKYKAYFKNGKPYMECIYKYNLRDGFCITYFENGRMELEAFYSNDLRHNNWNYYSESGELLYTLKYNLNQLLNSSMLDSIQSNQLNEMDGNKGKILDPAEFLNNPSEYMIRNRMNR
ncbi:MAG: toxin-antitoxin system YwqK family antitoxin [Mariniphaga sp.]|nr:toxin-antitoxin system YwqK family antitoxin [Mariniphaga sp.]